MGTVLEQSCVSGVLAPELFLRLLDYLSPETLDPQGVTIQKESELLIAAACARTAASHGEKVTHVE